MRAASRKPKLERRLLSPSTLLIRLGVLGVLCAFALGGAALAINIAIYAFVFVRHRRRTVKELMIGTQ